MKYLAGITLFLSTLVAFPSFAATVAESVEIKDPYVRMVPPNAAATAAFMVIKNNSSENHAIVSAKANINKITELHTHIHDNGVMRMRQVKKIDLPANGEAVLKPGGLHVMLIDLNAPVKEGQKIEIDLTFDDGSTKTIIAEGRPLMMPMKGKMGHMKGGMQMHKKTLSNGQNVNPMRLVMHANPAFPNLTGIAIKNADDFGLTENQINQLKAWTKKNGDKMKQMFQQVRKLEKDLIQDSLAGISKAELMAKFEKTLKLRQQIAETKIDCRDNMQKVLNAEQFNKLVSIYPMM